MTDPTQPGQPTEEELRAYLEQLRAADPAEVLVQAYRMLGTGAEVKLGRPDARILIDAMAAMVQAVDNRLDPELAKQMRDGIGQLQMTQVQSEREAAGQAGAGEGAAEGGGGEAATAGPRSSEPGGTAPGGAPGGGQPAGAEQEDKRMTDRLWIPGRGPDPR